MAASISSPDYSLLHCSMGHLKSCIQEKKWLPTVVAYPPNPSINILRRVLHVPGARQFFVDCVDTVSLSCVKTFLNTGTPWTQEATELSWRPANTPAICDLPQSGDLAPLIEISQEVAPRRSFYPSSS